MAKAPADNEASTVHGVRRYERHRPEHTLLYRLVEQHYPEFADAMAAQGKPLPAYDGRYRVDSRLLVAVQQRTK